MTRSYPRLTPYQIANNSPIAMEEIEGVEGKWFFIDAFQKAFGWDWNKNTDSDYVITKTKELTKEIVTGTIERPEMQRAILIGTTVSDVAGTLYDGTMAAYHYGTGDKETTNMHMLGILIPEATGYTFTAISKTMAKADGTIEYIYTKADGTAGRYTMNPKTAQLLPILGNLMEENIYHQVRKSGKM